MVGVLNLLVDPYDRFGFNRLGTYISADREYKATEVQRFPSDAILLGDSRAAMINVSGVQDYRFFNAAFAGATGEEMRSFVNRFVRGKKLVVLGLDLFSFGPVTQPPTDPFTPLSIRRALEYTLSIKNADYSIRTLASALAGKPRDYQPDGSYHEANWATRADRVDAATADRKVTEVVDSLTNYQFEANRMVALRDIRDTLAQRGIPVVVYLAPMNQRVWERLQGTTGYSEMLKTREAILRIFPRTIDLTDSGYSAPEGFFRGDPLHFRSLVGERFLKEQVLPAKD